MDADGLLGFNTSENSSDEVIYNGFDENSVQTGADGGLGLNASGDSSDEVVKFCQHVRRHDPMGAADEDRGTWPDGSVLQQPLGPLPTMAGACALPFAQKARGRARRIRTPARRARDPARPLVAL